MREGKIESAEGQRDCGRDIYEGSCGEEESQGETGLPDDPKWLLIAAS